MDINKSETVITSLKTIFESSSEQSIDTDFSLPDYYPEITKILKIMSDVNILSSQCGDNGVSIGGQVVLTLLYVGSDGQPNSFTHIFPFAKSIDTKDATCGTVTVVPRVGYLNTKAMGPRKVEVHGSIALAISVIKPDDISVLTETDCEGIYTKCSTKQMIEPKGIILKSVFIDDELQIPQTKPTLSKILRSSAVSSISECKTVSGKLVVKGDVDIDILYCPADSGKPLLLSERRGFSQIIDCDYEIEGLNFDVYSSVDSLELHPKTSIDGEVRNIALEVKIGLEVMPYIVVEKCFVTDAFSGKYIADITKKDINCDCVAETINENFVCKKSLDFGVGSISEIYDTWCKISSDHTSYDGNDILSKGQVIVNILGVDGDNEPIFFERPIDFEYRYSIADNGNNFRCRPDISLTAVNNTLTPEGRIDISVELKIKATVYKSERLTAVTNITVDKDNTHPKDNETAVILYFPENETVWEIARKYKTSPEKICEVNAIDNIEDKVSEILLIPNI